ncbi:Glycosyltransferase involved in cell wall bisynthesis [Maribacter aquivivus]|uniref:Glycosyltransferase involved in cell wall bisynthesis n=1 Tax=Maribacter aquivivus TaxID=228958 RepID=A0A1M6LHY6_9FLAO|nr:glycosyltransferase [Maribacter aquivivus]SHJ70801.1 Glycosyltransferase involved in cell wall bisynthesis [Maribacter aquivivus]
MRKLIFDIAITGHHSEYIEHLVNYLESQVLINDIYYFVIHPELLERFPRIKDKSRENNKINFVPISKEELRGVVSVKKIKNSLAQFKIMNHYAKILDIDHVISLDFHSIKYGVLLKKPAFTISSILFLQFFRLPKKTLNEKMEYYKRYFIIKWAVANKQIKNVFVLNDDRTVDFMNKEFNTNCFQILPDPIPVLKPLESFNINKYYNISPGRKIFLHIGSLGDRKGTNEVIESTFCLDEDVQRSIAIVLVGKASFLEDEKKYHAKMRLVQNKTEVQIIWDNQFVTREMMKSLFDNCDAVLLPYKNAEFSSGILGHAAASRKTVIATGAGLIQELVNKYNLGILLEKPDADSIAEKISFFLKDKPATSMADDFVAEHNPNKFCKVLLQIK